MYASLRARLLVYMYIYKRRNFLVYHTLLLHPPFLLPVHIQRVFQLLRQGLDLGPFLQELLAQLVGLFLETVYARHSRLEDAQIATVLSELDLQDADLIQTLAILDLSFVQNALMRERERYDMV